MTRYSDRLACRVVIIIVVNCVVVAMFAAATTAQDEVPSDPRVAVVGTWAVDVDAMKDIPGVDARDLRHHRDLHLLFGDGIFAGRYGSDAIDDATAYRVIASSPYDMVVLTDERETWRIRFHEGDRMSIVAFRGVRSERIKLMILKRVSSEAPDFGDGGARKPSRNGYGSKDSAKAAPARRTRAEAVTKVMLRSAMAVATEFEVQTKVVIDHRDPGPAKITGANAEIRRFVHQVSQYAVTRSMLASMGEVVTRDENGVPGLILDGWGNPLYYAAKVQADNYTADDFLPRFQTAFFASAGPDGKWGSHNANGKPDAEAADNIYSFNLD